MRRLRSAGNCWRQHLSSLLALATILAASPALATAGETRDPRAVAILKEAATAFLAVPAATYDFEYGHRDDPTGWVVGSVAMRRVSDASDSWVRVRGTVQAQPAFGATAKRFDYGTDGERGWSVDHTAKTFDTAPVGAGANRLAWNAVFGIVPEFIESRPLWKELGSPDEVALLEPETIDGTLCDVVRVTFRFPGSQTVNSWYLGRQDHLPRRLRWSSTISGTGALTIGLSNVRVAELDRKEFQPPVPAAYHVAEPPTVAGLGESVPSLELSTVDGARVSLAGLRRHVVVMDFWNTWCYICHKVLPESQELWKEFEARGVRFFGVNVVEAEEADPAKYWRDDGFPYPLLVAGEELAGVLDFPWQPAVAVIGADGRLLFAQLGASHDRADKVRQAVRRGLAATRAAR